MKRRPMIAARGTAMAARSTAVAALALLALTALPLALGSCARRAVAAVQQPRLVSVAPVARRDFILSAEYAASLVPLKQVNVTPKVGGKVKSVLVEVGMAVSAGQALCALDASDYEAQYRQAEGALGSAKASLTRTSDSALEQQKVQAKSALDQAQVAYQRRRAPTIGRKSSTTPVPWRSSSSRTSTRISRPPASSATPRPAPSPSSRTKRAPRRTR